MTRGEIIARSSLVAAAGVGLGMGARRFSQRSLIDLQGQVVLITGSSRGLGFVMAQEFAEAGAQVVLCARDERGLERARQDLARTGAEVLAVPCDVSNRDQVQRLVEEVNNRFGRIDVLVNNAGIITVGPLQTQALSDFEESMDIMFWGVAYPTLAVLPQMLERKSGRIVNITSIGGKVSVPHLLPYSCAKFAAVGFSEGLRAELAKEGVKVTTVVPGLMRTGSPVNAFFKGKYRAEHTWFTLSDSLPLITSMSARRAARRIVHATRRGDTEIILTPQAHLATRLHGLFPGTTANILSLVNRLLPNADGVGEERVIGKESETSASRSFLTALTQRAARAYHQYDEKPGQIMDSTRPGEEGSLR